MPDDVLPPLEDFIEPDPEETTSTDPESRLLIPGLTPGENYVLRVRAQNELGQFSPWSEAVQVEATVDPNIPNPIRGLTGNFENQDAILNWQPPVLNTAGEHDIGIAYYEIKIEAAGKVFTYTSTTPSFTYRYEQNLTDFGGGEATPSAQGVLRFSVSAVNLLRKKSAAQTITLTSGSVVVDPGTGGGTVPPPDSGGTETHSHSENATGTQATTLYTIDSISGLDRPTAEGDYSLAAGFRAEAFGDYATAVGAHADASGLDSVAVGGASSSAIGTVAIGAALAQRDYAISH